MNLYFWKSLINWKQRHYQTSPDHSRNPCTLANSYIHNLCHCPFLPNRFLLNSSQQNKDQINNLDLKTCLLMNVSYCEQTKNAHNFTVVLYNPLSRVVSHHITLPVDFNSNWKITDQNGTI